MTVGLTMDERAAQEQGKGLATRRREAFERTLLARERSLSAWMRTGLASIAGGFVIAKLAGGEKPAWLALVVGTPLVIAGARRMGRQAAGEAQPA